MITPQIKDAVLKIVYDKCAFKDRIETVTAKDFTALLPNTTFKEIVAIIYQFESHGLIKIVGRNSDARFSIKVLADAADIINRGGFTRQQEMFEATYNELVLEIKKLQKEHPTLNIADRFTGVLANLVTIGAFIGAQLAR